MTISLRASELQLRHHATRKNRVLAPEESGLAVLSTIAVFAHAVANCSCSYLATRHSPLATSFALADDPQ